MKRVATNTNWGDIFDFDEQQQRKFKKKDLEISIWHFKEKIDTWGHIICLKSNEKKLLKPEFFNHYLRYQ